MKGIELLNKLESYIKDYGCGNGTLELLDELRDNLNIPDNKCCNTCSTNYQRCRIFIAYWKSTTTNTVEASKCFYCMKYKFKEIKQ